MVGVSFGQELQASRGSYELDENQEHISYSIVPLESEEGFVEICDFSVVDVDAFSSQHADLLLYSLA